MKERIKAIRNAKGMNQTKFANCLSMSRSAVCKLESGENNPSDQTIKLICKEFNVDEEWLRTGNGDMFIDMDLEDELMQWAGTVLASESDNFKKRFVRMLSKLSEDEWELLAKMAQELVDTEKATDE